MEAQPNGSVSGHRHLEAELTEKLEGVVLPEMYGVHEQCIYIVRERIRQINPKAYTPQVVSIGPSHNPWGSAKENNMLKPMEELKLKYLKGFLDRTKLRVTDILHKLDALFTLDKWENRIRSCYDVHILASQARQGTMEAQPNGSGSGHQLLKAELTKKLEGVVLPEMSRVHEQCIYIVPQRLRQINPNAYTPQVVSIGPFHNPWGSGEESNMLKPMEELKLKYLKGFLNRTELRVTDILLKLDEFFKLDEWENRIRNCYAGPISYNSNDFLKMIIIDACFIIEHFLRHYRFSEWKEKDPLMLKPSLLSDIRRDLILLKNQLPFFVLEDIYNLVAGKNLGFPSYVQITFHYFQPFNSMNINPKGVCPKHFTDLRRTFFLPSSFDFGQVEIENVIRQVYGTSQLLEAGLVFKVSESKCLLDLKFDKGVLTMPCFHVQDSTETYLRNIMAFEEYNLPYSAYITQHLCILDNLINTEKDVSILVDKNIIVNWIGDANSVATMVNKLCKNIWLPGFHSKYLSLCNSLNGFYENPRNKYKAIFIHEYFNTPVKIASTIAAVLLLSLTLIQTIFSVCSYLKE